MKKQGSTLKLTFAKGASLKDPAKLFNSKPRRKRQTLIRAAVALNASGDLG